VKLTTTRSVKDLIAERLTAEVRSSPHGLGLTLAGPAAPGKELARGSSRAVVGLRQPGGEAVGPDGDPDTEVRRARIPCLAEEARLPLSAKQVAVHQTTPDVLLTTIYWQNEHLQHLTGILWGLVQACELYSNHLTTSRNTPDMTPEENRFARLTSTTTIGTRAFNQALELL
jgi:hypothetical protein